MLKTVDINHRQLDINDYVIVTIPGIPQEMGQITSQYDHDRLGVILTIEILSPSGCELRRRYAYGKHCYWIHPDEATLKLLSGKI